VGPGNYDNASYTNKESFNYGSVPFGSHSNQQFLYQSRLVHNINSNPGPGQYGPSTTTGTRNLVAGKAVTYDSKHGLVHIKAPPGQSFGKSGLSRDQSGIRDLGAIHG
jgi:hypothetical protein